MRTLKVVAASLALGLGFGLGCNQSQGPGQGAADVPFYPGERQGDVTLYRNIQFEDVPVPASYTLIRESSHSFQSSRFRTGVFHYEGPEDWRDAIIFFSTETPKSHWEFINYEKGYDFRLMRFRKGPEQLIVVVRDMGGWSRAEIQLDNVDRNDLLLKGKLKAGNRP